jgi:hypothetical protein
LGARGNPPRNPDAVRPDKNTYTLFNPTPADQVRDFNSDNGGVSNSPFTVDAGHFQFENETINFYKSDNENYFALNNFTFRVGITNSVDLEVANTSYISRESQNVGDGTQNRGFGDITLLTKVNFIGNDSGLVGVGIQPFVKLPTNTRSVGNNHIEGGINLPVNITLSDTLGLAIMPFFLVNKNLYSSGYLVEGGYAICFNPNLVGHLSGWLEFAQQGSTEDPSTWSARSDLGLAYQFSSTFNIIGGTFIGLTATNPTLNPFFGFTIRQ